MKRLQLLLLILPQLVFSQTQSQFFCLDTETGYLSERMRCVIGCDTTLCLDIRESIFGLSLSGQIVFGNDDDSYIRVLLLDENHYEYLVYENYPLLAGTTMVDFVNTAFESIFMNRMTPYQLRVEARNSTLRIDALNYRTTPSSNKDANAIQQQQTRYIAERLNANLAQRNMTWRAGVTSISEMTYEEKKDVFGGRVPMLYGFEYYKGGVFVMPEANTRGTTPVQSNRSYAASWDWRNRHGRNWMTPVKDQGVCSSCWAFGALGALEAYINLYFNNAVNYDLSEQEIITCTNNHCHPCDVDTAYKYIRTNGVVLDSCFAYTASERSCYEKCNDPIETIYIDEYGVVPHFEDSIKKHVQKAPITIGSTEWFHVMTLAGYKTLALGDTIYNGGSSSSPPIVIDNSHQNLIGQTAWLIKNSFGNTWGDSGFGYVIIGSSHLAEIFYLSGAVHSQLLTDEDIILEDRDGDGYYFWGIGPKPANCPWWIPDIPDGDDSNVDIGQLDDYGNYYYNETIIKSDVTYSISQEEHLLINIVNGGTLRITGNMYLMSSSRIRICNGGVLIVDGGMIEDANIFFMPGSKLIIKNNGTIKMAGYTPFDAPEGVIVEIENGKILTSGN